MNILGIWMGEEYEMSTKKKLLRNKENEKLKKIKRYVFYRVREIRTVYQQAVQGARVVLGLKWVKNGFKNEFRMRLNGKLERKRNLRTRKILLKDDMVVNIILKTKNISKVKKKPQAWIPTIYCFDFKIHSL